MKLSIALITGLFLIGCSSQEPAAPTPEPKVEEVKVAEAKVEEVKVEPKAEPVVETKPADPVYTTVCLDVQGKDGKPVIDPATNKPKQTCTKVRVHEKYEGTKVEDAKKK